MNDKQTFMHQITQDLCLSYFVIFCRQICIRQWYYSSHEKTLLDKSDVHVDYRTESIGILWAFENYCKHFVEKQNRKKKLKSLEIDFVCR